MGNSEGTDLFPDGQPFPSLFGDGFGDEMPDMWQTRKTLVPLRFLAVLSSRAD